MFEVQQQVQPSRSTAQARETFQISSATAANILKLIRELKELEAEGVISTNELESKTNRLLRLYA